MERLEGLKKIKTKQAYEEAKNRLESYLKQYKWITETETPYEDISKAVFKCAEIRKKYEDKEDAQKEETEDRETSRKAELENERNILALKKQYEEIKGDTYIGNLRRNIAALYIAIGDYEARIETRSKISRKTAENLPKDMLTSRSMRRFRFFLANLTGMIPGEVNMEVESRKEILQYILKNYDLVSLEATDEPSTESEEKALVVVQEIDTLRGKFYDMFERPVADLIAAYGVVENKTSQTKAETSEKEPDNGESQGNVVPPTRGSNKDKTHSDKNPIDGEISH